ncbi:class I SAM-dependent methyltransferase [Bacteroidota bacterium]
MDVSRYNSLAWDIQVDNKNRWTVPVNKSIINDAKKGKWEIILTPTKAVPKEWFPKISSIDVLCLASGGGQQGPILSAAGGNVTVFDNSNKQLEQDRYVAERDSLSLNTVKGDMRDLSVFPDKSFDLIVHPVSNLFVPGIISVWAESYRVLRSEGIMISGFMNPVHYIFNQILAEREGILEVKYTLPYSDIENLTEVEKQKYISEGTPFEFSHTLEEQISGQLKAGFVITGFYEDRFENIDEDPLSKYLATFIATRSQKLSKI